MTTESELRQQNYQLNNEKDILELRRENRELKRQIERMKAGKSAKPFISKFGLTKDTYMTIILSVLYLSLIATVGITVKTVI